MTVMSSYSTSSSISSLASNAYNVNTNNSSYYSTLTSGPGTTTAYINANSVDISPNINRDWSKKGPGFNNVNGNTVYFGNICTVGCRSFA